MVASPGNPDTKPYGIHRIWITPYADTDGTILGPTSYRLPLGRTLAFTESEDFDTLDGDDKSSVAIQGKGATVDGSIESGGLDLMTFSIITGGQLIESGAGPTLKRVVRKRGSDQRPYWRAEGQTLSNGGGDNIARIFRCKANGKITADMKFGTFMTPQIDFAGTPMPGDDDDYLYEIEFNATRTTLGSTPVANPFPIPSNVTPTTVTSTTIGLTWGDLTTADSYVVEKSTDGETFTLVASGSGGAPSDAETELTGLTQDTLYWLRVAAVFGGKTGDYCSPVAVSTLPGS